MDSYDFDVRLTPAARELLPLVYEELRKLAELRDSGVITPADYDQAKANVLA